MTLRRILALGCVFAIACGDDDGGADTGTPDIGADAALDSSVADTGTADMAMDSAEDSAMDSAEDSAMDAGAADTGAEDMATDSAMDAGPVEVPTCGPGVEEPCCFDISLTLGDLPFVLEDTFDSTTPTWMRPLDMCPAEATSEEAVPFVAYTYCNKGDAAADFAFEAIDVDDDGLPVVLVAYSGAVLPEDVRACGAYAEPILGAAELILSLDPGQVVTVVTTLSAAEEGTVQSVAGEPIEK